jgi:uncharacterized protein YacL
VPSTGTADLKGITMGYGLGVFLLALGLILALAVQDSINAVDLTLVGWILALAGVLVIVLTAVQANARRRSTTTATTVHGDGSQTTRQATTEHRDPPPPAV